MNLRHAVLEDISERNPRVFKKKGKDLVQGFGSLTFNRQVMEKMLSKKIYSNLCMAMDGKTRINPSYAEAIAQAMKDWAMRNGATHFCHWFQPMNGLAAEKHDAFIDWKSADVLIEKFSGKQLMRGEADASSFPSGGLRKTAEARGYTTWDPSSHAFLWRSGGAATLCIPSIFFSWTGKVLDMKIPLLRSDAKICQAALRLLNLLNIEADSVYSNLGCEQEYFLVDHALFQLRPDLLMVGRTVLGAPPPKGQELEDHYFGTIKERVIAYMSECEAEALALGIPLKTRHNEVAPQQFEAAPIFEKAGNAVDHNVLLMEVMRQVAVRHRLACLLHEKPFARINGSGKHCNWSLATDNGLNLFDPTAEPHNSLLFLIMITATLQAIHKHAALLRASIASAGNDHRLGGHEAPPVIISVYLGESLEKVLKNIEEDRAHKSPWGETLDLKIPSLPALPLDETDRNRTSPFAFTGNKFEFRAVGSSANCAQPVTVLNVIVAESLNQIVDEIEKGVIKKRPLGKVAMEVVRKSLKASRAIRFSGDNYSAAWPKEAKKRKLPIINRSLQAIDSFITKSSVTAFEGVLSKDELEARVEVMTERYAKVMNIEASLLIEMFRTQILPVALEYQKQIAKGNKVLGKLGHSVGKQQEGLLKKLTGQINLGMKGIDAVEAAREKAVAFELHKRAEAFCHDVGPKCEKARGHIDKLEEIIDDRLWILPKYRELLNFL